MSSSYFKSPFHLVFQSQVWVHTHCTYFSHSRLLLENQCFPTGFSSHSFSVSLALYHQFNTTHILSHSLTCVGWIFTSQTSDNWTNVNIFSAFLWEFFLLLSFQLSGGCELTVVIHDFVASNGGSSGELTVRRGQTVEVLERLHDKPDWCLVRTTDRSPAQEGIVPCSMLCIAHSRSSMEMEGLFNHKGRRRIIPFLYFRFLYLHAQVDWEIFSHAEAHLDFPQH